MDVWELMVVAKKVDLLGVSWKRVDGLSRRMGSFHQPPAVFLPGWARRRAAVEERVPTERRVS
jgi:hypothetical protein